MPFRNTLCSKINVFGFSLLWKRYEFWKLLYIHTLEWWIGWWPYFFDQCNYCAISEHIALQNQRFQDFFPIRATWILKIAGFVYFRMMNRMVTIIFGSMQPLCYFGAHCVPKSIFSCFSSYKTYSILKTAAFIYFRVTNWMVMIFFGSV